MARKLKGKVVVLTGASSGIGRAAAGLFAREGCRLVLAARGEEALERTAAECRALGADALAVPTDVTDEAQVRALAARAMEEFGGFDVWVNDAGVCAFGEFLDQPPEAFRRVVETNFFGVVHGCRAALRHFMLRDAGVLINVASVLGKEGIPYLGAYVASKEAVIGLSSCLREELHGDHDVHVCTVLPPSIDTPIWQHSANYTGRRVHPPAPVYEPEQVARAIVRCAARPRRIVNVGLAGPAITAFHKASPSLYEAVAGRVTRLLMFERSRAAPAAGNLFEGDRRPMEPRGGWGSHGKAVDRLAIAALAAAGGALAWRRWTRA